jgi:putative nucleotidyltransferase with HDIG domain
MKQAPFMQSLTSLYTNWQRRYKALRRKYLFKTSQTKGHPRQNMLSAVAKLVSHLAGVGSFTKMTFSHLVRAAPTNMGDNSHIIKSTLGVRKIKRLSPVIFAVIPKKALLCVIAVVSLTGVMGHKLYNQPQLQVGRISLQTVRAPYTSTIEDKHKTNAQRNAASNSSEQILMIDTKINQNINQGLQEIFSKGNEIRTIAGSFPYFDTFALSISTQRYLRGASNLEWQAFLITIDKPSEVKLAAPPLIGKATESLRTCNKLACVQKVTPKEYRIEDSGLDLDNPNLRSVASGISVTKGNQLPDKITLKSSQSSTQRLTNTIIPGNADFTQAASEFEAYRLMTSELNISALVNRITQAREGYVKANEKIAQLANEFPDIAYNDSTFLNLSDDDWATAQNGIQQSAERILTQGIPPGLPANILENTVKLQIQSLVPKQVEPLATKLLLSLLEPNLKKDELKTQIRAKQAASDVQPVMMVVTTNTIIVRQGKKITEWDFQVLEHYGKIRREIRWKALILLTLVVASAVGVFVRVESRVKYRKRQSDRLLILLLTLSTPIVLTMGTPYTTWSALGLLLGSFYGSTIGITVVSLLLILLPISLEMSKIGLIAGAAGAILGTCIAQKLRSREELALLGVAIALTQGGVYLLFKIILGEVFGASWYLVFKEALFFGCSGLGWSIVALGLSPYLEQLFDLVTPIRLAELANPNRSLLKRLAAETPGTFQHTLFVSTLAEAAARQLKCNVELVRAGTLYHDIGKMHDSQAFIENQMGRPNKHDTEIKNPWISAGIIKKHVSEGLVIARKHRLPTAIQAFIPEHQGTMTIAYFYYQAQQLAKENPCIEINDADFRYDGPIPQSRETGIVMLADSCEAALRSLKDATPEQALIMVNNILRARWQENQLVDSGISRSEMTKIGEIFVEVWQQFHHKRVAYPKSIGHGSKIS